ncbi:aspartic proteinase nepenthesin-2-like [Asparagus officinalis]|nr:aspartic proteinase nepenthesin-2-like [Asparagus officinalis]
MRPPIFEQDQLYLAVIGIGTGNEAKVYYLDMDTGSGLTWIQCQPCNPCFPQTTGTFNPSTSPTYRHMPCDDPLCVRPYGCIFGVCKYMLSYADGSYITGDLSTETFNFPTSPSGGQFESIPDLAFGCTHGSGGMTGYTGGILGLDSSPQSIINQLIDRTGGLFSYCLFHPTEASGDSYLSFGNDIVMNGPVQTTPLLDSDSLYYVNLIDISVADQRLNLPPGTFDRKADGTGGCIIDSGAAMSYMIAGAYDVMRGVLVGYFRSLNLVRVNGADFGMSDYKLCCLMPASGLGNLPSVTFHLQGADLQVGPKELYVTDDQQRVFCLGVFRNKKTTDIGAHQQFNTRFKFDIVNMVLSFVPENCAAPQ